MMRFEFCPLFNFISIFFKPSGSESKVIKPIIPPSLEVKELEKEVVKLESKKKVNKKEVAKLKRKVTNTKKQIEKAGEAVKEDNADEAVKFLKKFSK